MVVIDFPLEARVAIPAVSSAASLLLTAGLVYLYSQQRSIQENQEELMERQYDCVVFGYISYRRGMPRITLENMGPSGAYGVSVECDLGYQTIHFSTPLLKSGQSVSELIPHPLGRVGNSHRGVQFRRNRSGHPQRQLNHYLGAVWAGEIEEQLEIVIRYRNSTHGGRRSKWTVNFLEDIKEKKNSDKRIPNDGTEILSDSLRKISDSIDDLQ